jgi:hypothetical protein
MADFYELKDILTTKDTDLKLDIEQIAFIEELKAVPQEVVKCYRLDDRSIKSNTVNYNNYTVWKYFSNFGEEVIGDYLVATINPEDILYDNESFQHKKKEYPDLIIKPGKYDIVKIDKDLSKEAHLALYDDGENKNIPEDIIREIKKLKAVPKDNIICRCLKKDCTEEDDHILVYKYSYCIYNSAEDESIFDEDLYYNIEVKPDNVVFSSDHCDSFMVKLCCDLIITPGRYKIIEESLLEEDEGDEGDNYVEDLVDILRTEISKINDDLNSLKSKMDNLTNYEQEFDDMTKKVDELSVATLEVSTNLTNLIEYIKNKQ